MKTKLKPASREKKRYLLLEINANDILIMNIKETIEKSILDFLGTLEYAKASPEILSLNKKNGIIEVILAVNRKELDKVRASLCLSKMQINVKRVSGTLKKLAVG